MKVHKVRQFAPVKVAAFGTNIRIGGMAGGAALSLLAPLQKARNALVDVSIEYGFKPSGEGVFYASLPENDLTLEAALAAATQWAGERGVPRSWVQTSPE